MENLRQALPYVAPIIVLHYALVVFALIDLVKRKKVRFGNKWLWGAIILFLQVFGPVLYFIFRGEDQY